MAPAKGPSKPKRHMMKSVKAKEKVKAEAEEGDEQSAGSGKQ